MGNDFPILTAVLLTPVVGALIAFVLPARRPEFIRAIGYFSSAATLGFAGWLLWHFHTGDASYQYVESHAWMDTFGVRYKLGVDGISIFMVVLTALLFVIGMLASESVKSRIKSYTVWMLLLEASLLGVFLSLDLILFFVCFELVLVPMYFLIAGWGHGRRVYAAMKFFVFTMTGSAFLLIGILTLAFLHSSATGTLTFDLPELVAWAPAGLSTETARWLFLAFFVAFAVKVPLFPLHTWLPDAHTEAPTAGSVILAGVLLKMGAYGFLRLSLPLFPEAAVRFAPLLMMLATIGIVYGAIVAAVQPNLKRLIAYSSVAHMGFVVLGTFALNTQGIDGAIIVMISHGLTTGALFLFVGMLYDRNHTYEISAYRGIWKVAPILGGLFLVTAFASIGVPGFSGFVGEFLTLLGAFLDRPWFAVVATTGVILAAVYMLWAYQRVFTGEPDAGAGRFPDIGFRELATVVPLLGLSLFLGLYPRPVLDRIEPSVKALVAHVEQYTNHREPAVSSEGPAPVTVIGAGAGGQTGAGR